MKSWFLGVEIPWRLRIIALDLAQHCAAIVLALALRDNMTLDPHKLLGALPYIAFTLAIAAIVTINLHVDRTVWRFTTIADVNRVILGVFVSIAGATVLTFIFDRLDGLSRSIPVLHFFIASFALVGARVGTRAWSMREGRPIVLPSLAPVESNMRAESVLIVGVNRLSAMLLAALTEHDIGGARVAGLIGLDRYSSGTNVSGHHVFGPHENLTAILGKLAVHGVTVQRIILTVPIKQLPRSLRSDIEAVASDKAIRVENVGETIADFCAEVASQAAVVDNDTLAHFKLDRHEIDQILLRPYWRIKRAIESAVAAVLLAAASPILIILAILVYATLGSPVFFWQIRTGYFGRSFRMFKFRSMADTFGDEGQAIDPERRLNGVGRLLRATHLDELPQLWNILVGEMSFVGPRPLLPVDQAPGASFRCLARPGLTGWAQVMGGRGVEADDKMALDIFYVRHASLRLDLEICARTIPVIIFGERINTDAIARAWQELRSASQSGTVAVVESRHEVEQQFVRRSSKATGQMRPSVEAADALPPVS